MNELKNYFSRVLLLLADGARFDVVSALLTANKLPNIKKHVVDRGAFLKNITVFPSATGPAYLPFLTGCFPGKLGIPGIRWFDRKRFANPLPGLSKIRSYVGFESYFLNRDIPSDIKLLFSFYKQRVNFYNFITKDLSFKEDKTRLIRWKLTFKAARLLNFDDVDRYVFNRLLQVLSNKDDAFYFAVFPAIDENAHMTHPHHPRTIKAYITFDRYIGLLMEKLIDLGIYDNTLVVIVSDHGLTKTDSHLDLANLLQEQKYRVFFHPLIYKRFFNAAVMVSGNAMAHIYIKNGSRWGNGKPYEKLLEQDEALLNRLVSEPAVDWISCKTQEGFIVVRNKNGELWFKLDGQLSLTDIRITGENPLQVDLRPKDSMEVCFNKSLKTDYPDVVMQLYQLFSSNRTGDIVVNARVGHDLRRKWEYNHHKASHGALCKEQMEVPVLINTRLKAKISRSVDIFPTILSLTGKEIPVDIDGHVLE
jgi:predicted AlkP superfamily phosphohydrolase/phosphomutase